MAGVGAGALNEIVGAVASYGDAGEAVLHETPRPADGPPQTAGVARACEQAAAGAPAVARSSCETGSSSTEVLRRWTAWRGSFGLDGRIGTGRQWVIWIHIDDFLSVVEAALQRRPPRR